MRLAREQVALIGTLVLVGWLLRDALAGESTRRSRAKRSEALALERFPAPQLERAMPEARPIGSLSRDVFSEPRDARPLPPLEFEEPPLPPLIALRPPGAFAPAAAIAGRFLRADATPVPGAPLGALFLSEVGVDGDSEADSGVAMESSGERPAGNAEKSTPEERAMQLSSWKQLYDWIRIHEGTPLFGTIHNPNRYDLARRPQEAILFAEVVPETGLQRFPGQAPAAFARERVLEFGLADTVENRILLREREIGDTITPGQYPDVLAFANSCIDLRLESSKALLVAEKLFTLAAAIAPDDPAPRLGLARCYEAGFKFEKAFQEYQKLLAQFGHHALVHVQLAALEARFRLFDRTEQRLREAERLGRSAWGVQWALGRFLRARGRMKEALEHFELAYRYEPGAEDKTARAGIRLDLAGAYVAAGDLERASELFEKALAADPEDGRAAAGIATVALLEGKSTPEFPPEESGFERLLTSGLIELQKGSLEQAERSLGLAAQADPLRAWMAQRALSWLAEKGGHPEIAIAFAERAHEGNPEDAYILYQRGRLLYARGDLEGASASLRLALDEEPDFFEPLLAMGVVRMDEGDFRSAERYFARAAAVQPTSALAHAFRGINRVKLGEVNAAAADFDAALAIEPDHPLARNGSAWCAYRRGDSEKAIQQFAELDDLRRSAPEEDVHRAHARAQIARINDHLQKVVWSDRFERRSLRNDWISSGESLGVAATLREGVLELAGTYSGEGALRVYRIYPASAWIALEAEVEVRSATKARVGLFLSRERRGRSESEIQEELSLSRHREGTVQTRFIQSGNTEEPFLDYPVMEWPVDRPVRVRIERVGEGSQAQGRLLLDGVPVLEGVRLRSLAAATGDLHVGIFAHGETGRRLEVSVDNVEVVKRLQ